MKTIGSYEAKTRFDELLAEVAEGASIEITQLGVPVARLMPVDFDFDFEDAAAAIEEWRQYRRKHDIKLGEGITIRELIEEGRE